MVAEVATTIGSLVAKNKNRLDVRCADDLGEMTADLTKVRQTLFNLLSNACKFTENGTITAGGRTRRARRSGLDSLPRQRHAASA